MHRAMLSWRYWLAVAAIAWVAVTALAAAAAELQVPNPEFKEGTDAPAGWKLSGGEGRWVDRDIVEVTGTGTGSNQWQCDPLRFEPGALYRFQVRARQVGASGGSMIAGPSFANRDYHGLASEWKEYGHVFRVPDNPAGAFLRVGQWETKGTFQFDSVRLVPVLPVYKQCHGFHLGFDLGEGEMIRNGAYVFQGTFSHEGSNFHRPLASATAVFNTDRWCFWGDGQVTYRFGLPGYQFRSAEAGFTVNWHSRGACLAEVSCDGKTWRALVTQNGLGTGKAALPADLFPADTIYLRLRPAVQDSNFQVNNVAFQAKLIELGAELGEKLLPEQVGSTLYVDLPSVDAQKVLEYASTHVDANSIDANVRVSLRNPSQRSVVGEVELFNAFGTGVGSSVTIPPGRSACPSHSIRLRGPGQGPGKQDIDLAVDLPGVTSFRLKIPFVLPDYYRSDYGERFGGDLSQAALWWCDATHKVPRGATGPSALGVAARLWAAKNDREAVQIVVCPTKGLKRLTATGSTLAGPSGGKIPAENIKILRVYYHFVENPTDATGVRDWWPDALPLLDRPIDVPAGQNQPLWVLVYVPTDAKAGDYEGTISLKADGWSAQVALKLHVWDFALPERNHLETAFGLNVGTIFQYHQLKTEEDKRKVLDLYFQSFAEHRISPYDPTPLDPFRVKFLPDAHPPRAEVDFTAFDRAMSEAIRKYHFTGFSLPIQGMGGGTFHARYEPAIGKFGENTPEYQAMFASQVQQIEKHLRDKGWLDMAYVYWFDEPDPKDYPFVKSGMERLKKYGPGIRRMLTEEPQEALAGAVDIWCPVSFNYNHEAAEKRRARGERFWWYVCCGPKAPFCTLFIDHPATELRVWHWQTWQRKITGTLVWSTNYWTSDAAYPDKPQNPYLDPMGYVSGYSTPRGTKVFWGNGDGRFIYPPERAAVPGHSGPGPVIEPPVSSIRWEMLREGVEDYEYLWLLRDLLAKKRSSLSAAEVQRMESLLEVPESITKDMTTFTTDPAPIYARRAEIAAAIERLAR